MPALSPKPTRKVTAGVVGAAVGTLIVGAATWLGAPQPPVGFEGAIATVVGFVVAYMTHEDT